MTPKQWARTQSIIRNHTGSMSITENAAHNMCSLITTRMTLMRHMYHHPWPFTPPKTMSELRMALILEKKPELIKDPELVIIMAGGKPDKDSQEHWPYLKHVKDTIKNRGKRAK